MAYIYDFVRHDSTKTKQATMTYSYDILRPDSTKIK